MKYLLTLLIMTLHLVTYSQSILGEWETYDDKTKEKKAIIEIYKSENLYFARIKHSYVSDENATCETCTGSKKGEPIIGLIIVENLKEDGDEYKGGTIMDPDNGKNYKCSLKLVDNNKLKVRGYIGFSLLGRTQYWLRKK